MMINGFAPVLARCLVAGCCRVTLARYFPCAGRITALMMLGVIFVIKETLPVEERYQGTALSVYSGAAEGAEDLPLPGFHADDVLRVWCAVLVHFRFDVCVAEDSGLVRRLSSRSCSVVNSIGIVLFSAIATKLVGRGRSAAL